VHAGLRLDTGLALGGRYRLDAIIGSGTGEVWRAFDQRLNRPVVVKLLPGDPAVARQAAEAAAALRHPGVTAILDIAQHESVLFLVTELLEGQDLAAALTRQPGGLPVAQVPAVAVQVSAALAAAHAQGLVHGGLKPGDLFVMPDGQVKICGFGVLRQTGTARYPAPEQTQGSPADLRTDLYAFGCVLFELITGRQPHGGPPEPIRSLRPDAPAYLERLLLDLQAVDPAGRPPGASAVNDFLRASGADSHELTGMPEVAPTVVETVATTVVATTPAPLAHGSRRPFVLGAISGVVAAAVVGSGVFLGIHATSSPRIKHHSHTVAAPKPQGPAQGPVAPGGRSPASPRLVAGWKPAWSTSHGIIYEVPANWKVEDPATFIGEADPIGNIVLGSLGAADISTPPTAKAAGCTLVQSGVSAGQGLGIGSLSDSGLTGSLDYQAGVTAADWADLTFVNDKRVLPKVKLGENEHVTIDGQAASIVTATATATVTATAKPPIKRDWCHPPSGVVDAVAMQSRSGAYITFYVMSDEGIPGGLSQAVMHQIINTIRPLG
jgi:serine/threonine protein kinase